MFRGREQYFAKRAGRTVLSEVSGPNGTIWTFEPHVAEDILFHMLNEARAPIHFQQRLVGVRKDRARLIEIMLENGKLYRAGMSIDATYEGDLMARAGLGYTVGREANAQHHETLNGVRAETPKHQFTASRPTPSPTAPSFPGPPNARTS